jgi:hypothetical protein
VEEVSVTQCIHLLRNIYFVLNEENGGGDAVTVHCGDECMHVYADDMHQRVVDVQAPLPAAEFTGKLLKT